MDRKFVGSEEGLQKVRRATWTTHSRVSGMATGVHQATNTGSLRLTLGKIP